MKDSPVWQLPAPNENTVSGNTLIPASAKYHCFENHKSLCKRHAQDTDYYELGIESGEILRNPQLACKRCREKWIKKYLPELEEGRS